MLARQTRHELTGLWRTPVVLFFALGFPLVFFVLLSGLLGNETIDARSDVRLAQFLVPALASFGIAMATYAFLAIGFAEIRFNGVLRRFTGTPLPRSVLLGGRIGAGTVVALAAVALLLVVGVVLYDVQVIWSTMPAVVVTCIVAAVSFSALGLAVAALAPSFSSATAIANGTVIPLAFVSDMFVIAELPPWLDAIGWLFPLKHLVNALADAFNPFLDSDGLALDHLAVIIAWGVFGAVLAAWAIRRDITRADRGVARATDPTSGARATARAAASDARPRRDGRPSPLALINDQVRHGNALQWRDWSSPIFGIAMPVFLVALLPMTFAGDDAVLRQEIAQTVSATMTIYGAAIIAYVNMPQGIAEAREAGVLKRWAGTPLPAWAILAGRTVSALLLALIVWAGVLALAVPLYDVALPSAWLSALLVLLVSTASFSALGMGVVTLVRGGQAALAVCLGSLITLSFISGIFLVGAEFPPWLDAISWVFPLRHAVTAFVNATSPDATGLVLDPTHLGVVVAWGLAGVAVVLTRFSAEPRSARRPTTQVDERVRAKQPAA
jgi:ABC-type multidrug transport system permease subunit